ncbi:hypothetical protein C8K36_10727 [Rhodococcus sp. OK519]|uniref:hypothetical protein n=1 Tax=Rhodococcus sp. OK519 TaxID=2135729 RepID=UPI000D3DC869|nr:hypothetical protein C8K36_10727 [Rhodococcus sp. OK519]
MSPVKTVDVYTCREVLRIRAGVEQVPVPDEPGEYYWSEILRDCAESDVLEATWAHYRTTSRPLLPADILGRVGTVSKQRIQASRGVCERLLMDRALLGWDPDRLARWHTDFTAEIGRGASPEDACGFADAAASGHATLVAVTGELAAG